jgi:hypothetical protein
VPEHRLLRPNNLEGPVLVPFRTPEYPFFGSREVRHQSKGKGTTMNTAKGHHTSKRSAAPGCRGTDAWVNEKKTATEAH